MAKVPARRTPAQLAALDSALGLSQTGNNEVLFLWLKLALANRYEPAIPAAERFLSHVGRRKFVAPLYETLLKQGDWGRAQARRIYAANRAGYHAVTRGAVDKAMAGTN